MEEQLPFKEMVGGSSPPGVTASGIRQVLSFLNYFGNFSFLSIPPFKIALRNFGFNYKIPLGILGGETAKRIAKSVIGLRLAKLVSTMRGRLTVGHRPLEASIGVRIPAPQQNDKYRFELIFFN